MTLNPDDFDMFKILIPPALDIWLLAATLKDLNPAGSLPNEIQPASAFPPYAIPSFFNARQALIPPRRVTTLNPFCRNKCAP